MKIGKTKRMIGSLRVAFKVMLQFVNIFSANKVATLRSADLL